MGAETFLHPGGSHGHVLSDESHVEEYVMQSATQPHPASKKLLWAGRIVSAVPSLFLLLDGVMKLVRPPPDVVVAATVRLGYSENVILGLGIVLLACLAVYVIPRTAVLGAVLLTGYLGGAIATHVRVGDDLFSVFFPVIVGVLVWGGLILRDGRLRALIPLRR
jgi:DoxX-like family